MYEKCHSGLFARRLFGGAGIFPQKHTPLSPLDRGDPEGFSLQASRRGDTPSGNDRKAEIFTPMKGIEEFFD